METLLNKQQVADLLTISVKTLDIWVQNNKGPRPVRIGRMVRFKKSELEEYM